MGKYLDRRHARGGMPTEYHNRVDLDTALKERGMDGFYNKNEGERKELHTHLTERAMKKGGETKAKRDLLRGKMFSKKDVEKLGYIPTVGEKRG